MVVGAGRVDVWGCFGHGAGLLALDLFTPGGKFEKCIPENCFWLPVGLNVLEEKFPFQVSPWGAH